MLWIYFQTSILFLKIGTNDMLLCMSATTGTSNIDKKSKVRHICILQNTWKIYDLHLPGNLFFLCRSPVWDYQTPTEAHLLFQNVVLLTLLQDSLNQMEGSPSFLPDCHNAHWLRPLHLLPGRHGLQGTWSWGWQLTAVKLTILKERSGFWLHTARRV